MKIYLVRHGDAVEKAIDPQNPLSEFGRMKVKRLGEFLLPLHLQLDHIFHSGKLRAQQTAEILAKEMHYDGLVEARSGMNPLDWVNPIASEINQASHDTMYVGHMPFMSKLTAKLVIGNEGYNIIAFQTATILCLEKVEDEQWVIRWTLFPELLV